MYTIESLNQQLKDFKPSSLSVTKIGKNATIILNTENALPDELFEKLFPNASIKVDTTDFSDVIDGSDSIEWPVYQYIIKIQC